MHPISKRFFFLLGLLPVLAACKKDQSTTPAIDRANRLYFVASDNFSLTLFTVGLNYTHYSDTLLKPGPYTVLAPSDDAFVSAGYGSAVAVQAAGALMNQVIAYHVLGGVYRFDQLPFEFNQPIKTLGGQSLYVTHWVKNKDTVITMNGSSVISSNLPASNGLVQVINQVLNPPAYADVQQAIAADPALTFFNAALLRTGLADTLKGDRAFTVFAPTNQAFINMGFPSTDSIRHTDAATLSDILTSHILNGRKFINDFILTTDATNVSQQAMLNESNVTVTLVPNPSVPGSYSSITLQGTGNTSVSNMVRQNVLAGNGVLHTIDQVLKSNY